MVSMDYQNALVAIRAQQSAHPLSIIALAEPITTSQTRPLKHPDSQSRPSDTLSTSETESNLQLTPATLLADLAHYKDLFSKLRFSYLEQVTKEKYLRSIVGDPPLVVSHEDNLALEERLAVMKRELKTKKDEVDALVKEMEGRSRDVARAYDNVAEGLDILERVPAEIETLKAEVESLQAEIAARQGDDDSAHPGSSGDPRMHLSLTATEQALMEQRERNAEIDRQIADLQKQMPAKLREVERMDRELADLEKRRNESTKLAIEGRRRREQGGRDEVEELGRWYRANEAVMKGLLVVEETHGS